MTEGSLSSAAVREWPQVRRDVALAVWSLIIHGTERDDESWERARACVQESGEQAIMAAQPFVSPFVSRILHDVAPHVREDANAEAATWEVLQDFAPPRLAGEWPLAERVFARGTNDPIERVIDALRDVEGSVDRWGSFGAAPVVFTWHRERLLAPDVARAWLDALREQTDTHVATLQVELLRRFASWRACAVRKALDVAREHFPDLAADAPTAIEAVNAALTAILERLSTTVREDPDTALRDALRATGPHGKEDAERPADADAWRDPRRVAARLALALWVDVVGPRLSRKALPDALSHPVAIEVAMLHSRVHHVERDGAQASLRFPWGAVRPIDTMDARVIDLAARGGALLGSVLGHQVLRWEVSEGNRQWHDGAPDPRKIEVLRGWRGIAEALQNAHKGAPDQIRAIVHAQAHCSFALPSGGFGNLLVLEEHRGRGPTPGRVALILGDHLMPGYARAMAQDLGTSASARMARKLVPLLPLPPFVGRANDHGAQATFSLYLACALRLQAPELVEAGGALFTTDALLSMAERAGMPRYIGAAPAAIAALVRWTSDGSDAPAMFEVSEGHIGASPVRLHVGKAYQAARDFLVQAGQDEITGRARGKRSAAVKNAQKSGRVRAKRRKP